MPRFHAPILRLARPGQGTFLFDGQQTKSRPLDRKVAPGVVGSERGAKVDAILPLADGRVLVSVRSGPKKKPRIESTLLDAELRVCHSIADFGAPFVSAGATVGGCIDAGTGQLGILDLATLAVAPTELQVPGACRDGVLEGVTADGVLMRGDVELARDVTVLELSADGFVARKGNQLQCHGETSWTWDAPGAPSRVASSPDHLAVLWSDGVALLDRADGAPLYCLRALSEAPAGFYGNVGTLEDVALMDNGLVLVAASRKGGYPALVTIDTSGDWRISAAGTKGKLALAVAAFGLVALVGGNEKELRELPLLPDELSDEPVEGHGS